MTLALLVLGAVGHVILWVILVNRLHALALDRRLMDFLTAMCGLGLVTLPVGVAAALWLIAPGPAAGRWSLAWVAAWSYVAGCAVLAPIATVQRLWNAVHRERRGSLLQNDTTAIDLRERVAETLTAPGIATWLSRLPGNEALQVHLHEEQLAIPRLPAEHDGVRIVHLSDMHMSGRIAKAYFAEVVDEVNRLQPDMVALTGDLVERDRCIDWIPETLGRLRAPGGVFYVLGNHDMRVDERRLTATLSEAGLTHVGIRWQQVMVRNTPIVVAGNELPWHGPASDLGGCPKRSAAGLPLRVLLSHTPDQLGWARANDVDLMLAGHNHGGQVQLPLLGPILAPSLSGTRYASGVFRVGQTVMHVSRGTSGLTPIRWRCPPEIALLVLRHG
jgi:predicted MPP superfamily phosphohydrolase